MPKRSKRRPRKRTNKSRRDISSGVVVRALTIASNTHTGITLGRAVGRGLVKLFF